MVGILLRSRRVDTSELEGKISCPCSSAGLQPPMPLKPAATLTSDGLEMVAVFVVSGTGGLGNSGLQWLFGGFWLKREKIIACRLGLLSELVH